jgi:regulatory protein
VVADVLDDLERGRLLSDSRFSEQFARQRMERGQGPLKILSELEQRGVDEGTAREYVDPSDPDWLERARRAKMKRFGPEPPADFKDRARQSRFLAQRGFTAEQTAEALAAGDDDEEAF